MQTYISLWATSFDSCHLIGHIDLESKLADIWTLTDIDIATGY